MDKKYLPSKKFIKIVFSILLIIVVAFALYELIKFEKNKNKNVASVEVEITKGVQKDSNSNGIPDWEERLWGLNPNKNGEANKATILAKRAAINPNINSDKATGNSTEDQNSALSKEFFAAIMSLAQNGNLDTNSLNVITNSISQKIVAEPIPDTYTMHSLNVVPASVTTRNKYFIDFTNLISKYENDDIGSELSLIIQGIASNNQQIISSAEGIATAYRNFSQDLSKVPVPSDIAPLDLKIVNNYEKNAQAIEGLLRVEKDPLVGMKALINYNKYNTDLVKNIKNLSGILNNQ